MRVLKRVLKVLGLLLVLVVSCGALFAYTNVSRFDASMDKVYDVPMPAVTASTDPAVVARGKHVVDALGACSSTNCHGADLGGGTPIAMGPVGTLAAPNITPRGLAVAYSDGELARLVRYGVKKDGRSLRFMPAQDFSWLPDADLVAIVSYLRTVAPVDRPNGATTLGTLGKVLDRQGKFVLDVARHIQETKVEVAPPPAPTADFGRFVSRLCTGCHGETLSGGPLPGAPSSFAVPLNLTPDATGLTGWTYADFETLMKKGIRKNGKALDPLMPIESWKVMDDTELHALWAYLQTLPPRPFGGR